MFKFFEKNFIKNKSSNKKEIILDEPLENNNSFKDANEFLALLTENLKHLTLFICTI